MIVPIDEKYPENIRERETVTVIPVRAVPDGDDVCTEGCCFYQEKTKRWERGFEGDIVEFCPSHGDRLNSDGSVDAGWRAWRGYDKALAAHGITRELVEGVNL